MIERKILRNAEAARLLGVTEGALRQLRFKKKIPFYKNATGSRVYYLQNELEEWMLATRIKTVDEVQEEATKAILK